MVAFWDRDLRNRFANRAYIDWFGVAPSDMRGMHIRDLLGPRVFAMNLPYIEGALRGEEQLFERTLVDAAGRTRFTQASYTPQVVDGVVRGFFVLVTDITSRVRAELALRESVEQIALMHERQRIAADLHDLVIQRLYAASLELAAVSRTHPEDVPARVEAAIEGIDDAILELRSSIHSLNRGIRAEEVAGSLDRLIRQAARTLGFAPEVDYHGSLAIVPPAVSAEMLAVLNEALSNVARHADASRVHVRLDATADAVALEVADDGRGLGALTRTSGLANMRARAERLGGDFEARANRPRGTVVRWRVPLPVSLPSTSAPPAGSGPASG